MPYGITDNLSARERKNAWLQRRDARMQKIHAEEMDRALNQMNSTKHFLPSQLHALNLEQLIALADQLDNQTHRDADKALVKKEVLRRGKKRKIEGEYRTVLSELYRIVKDQKIARDKSKKQDLASFIEKEVNRLSVDAGNLLDDNFPVTEESFLKDVSEFYDKLLSSSKDYFKIKRWTLEAAKRFIVPMEGIPAWVICSDCEHLDYETVIDRLAVGARKSIFGK